MKKFKLAWLLTIHKRDLEAQCKKWEYPARDIIAGGGIHPDNSGWFYISEGLDKLKQEDVITINAGEQLLRFSQRLKERTTNLKGKNTCVLLEVKSYDPDHPKDDVEVDVKFDIDSKKIEVEYVEIVYAERKEDEDAWNLANEFAKEIKKVFEKESELND